MAQIYTHEFLQKARAEKNIRKEKREQNQKLIQVHRSAIANSVRLVCQLKYELAKLMS